MSDEAAFRKGDVLVLLTEDNEDDAELIRRCARAVFYSVGFEWATTLKRAAEFCHYRGGQIDLVLLDLGLPDSQGLNALKVLRPLTDAPIIIVSSLNDHKSVGEAMDLGADDLLYKPFQEAQLRLRLIVTIKQREKTDRTKQVAADRLKRLNDSIERRFAEMGSHGK